MRERERDEREWDVSEGGRIMILVEVVVVVTAEKLVCCIL